MKHLAHLILIVLTTAVFFGLMVFVEQDLALYEMVIPPADVTLEEWLDSFRLWGSVGLGISLAAALGWYVLGQWWFMVDSWNNADKRPIWGLLFLFPLAGAILACILTQRAQEGSVLAYAFYFINGLLSYYLATALFSPSSFKYTPIGADKLRRWNLNF